LFCICKSLRGASITSTSLSNVGCAANEFSTSHIVQPSQAIAPRTQIPMSLCCGTLTLWGLSGYRCVYCSATACAEGIRSTALQFESPTHRQKGKSKDLPFLFCICKSLRGASITSNKRSMSGCAIKKSPHRSICATWGYLLGSDSVMRCPMMWRAYFISAKYL
jgi:hypothetical protein